MMKQFWLLFGGILWGLSFVSCNDSEPQPDPTPVVIPDTTAQPPGILVEFFNPYAIPLEVRVFDHKGWIVKLPVPPNSSSFGEVKEGLYTIGVKDTATNQYLHFYPSGMHPDSLADTLNYGVKVNPKGERDVRYRFRPQTFKEASETRLLVDLSFDSTHNYALANARWLYLSEEDSLNDPMLRLDRMEESGEQFIMGLFSGAHPFPVPETMGVLNEPLPQQVDMASGFNGAITRLIEVPDTVLMDSLPSFVLGEILFQAMVLSFIPGDSTQESP